MPHRFINDRRGSFAVIVALAAVPLVAVVALAVDYGSWSQRRTYLRGVADGAALAAVQHLGGAALASDDQVKATAMVYVRAHLDQTKNDLSPNVVVDPAERSVTVTLQETAQVILSHVMSKDARTIGVSATAKISKPAPICFLALNQTATSAISLSGTGNLNANPCIVQANSTSTEAVALSGTGSINATQNCFVGRVRNSGTGRVLAIPETGCTAVADPFRTVQPPVVGPGCDYTNYQVVSSKALKPGTYCGGITVPQTASAVFEPGVYVLRDGPLRSSGTGNISGERVAMYLTGANAGVALTGTGSVRFTAPTTGALAGFVFYLDPAAQGTTGITIAGTGGLYYEGVLYFPSRRVTLSGTGNAATKSPYTMIVADSFVFSGTGNVMIEYDPARITVPLLPGAFKPVAGGAARLSS